MARSRPPLSVAILAGGLSRRMGEDKALLRIGGQTLLETVAERASVVADELFVVASNGAPYADLGFRVVPDVLPNSGSLGGIYSALLHAASEWCLVLACDMPLLNPDLLRFMATLPRTYDAAVPSLSQARSAQGCEETLETLHAIYSRSTVAMIQQRIRSGSLKIANFLADIMVARISESQIREFDPRLLSFFNVNRPEDLEFARALIENQVRKFES